MSFSSNEMNWPDDGLIEMQEMYLSILERINHLVRIVERQQLDANEEFLSCAQTCKYLGIGKTTLHKLLKNGTIPFIDLGGSKRIPKKQLQLSLLNTCIGCPTMIPDEPNELCDAGEDEN